MKDFDVTLTFSNGVPSPGNKAINSTGAATQDGTEMVAEQWNNMCWGPVQAVMDWAAGNSNSSLSGTPGVFDGLVEAAGASQFLEAIQKGNAVGPGMYVQRAIEDSPAVYGDRVIQLSGQGVLVASYPDLNTACWIGGNDAAQVAAKAAGEKFWRADDAIGTNPLAAGPYLMLPEMNPTYERIYLGDTAGEEVTLSIVGAGISSFERAIFIPHQTSDGSWFLRFNAAFSLIGADGGFHLDITGVTFKNVAGFRQPCSIEGTGGGGTPIYTAKAEPNTNEINITADIAQLAYYIEGDVELDSKPTWADDFSYDWYITY